MYIESITLQNYRCYENCTFEFVNSKKSKDDELDKNIVLITGKMATGKTSLFNAIGWCIHGIETEKSLEKPTEHELPIYNINSFNEKEKTVVRVEMIIKTPEHKDIKSFSIGRKAEFSKNSLTPNWEDIEITIWYKNNNKPEYISSQNDKYRIKQFIQQMFPEETINFYMFNGEFLQKTYSNSNKEIEKGLETQFKLEYFKNLIDTLDNLNAYYEKKLIKLVPKNINLEEKFNEILKKIEKNNKDIQDCKQKIWEYQSKLDEINNNIRELEDEAKKIQSYNELIKKRDEKKAQKEFLEESIKTNTKEKNEIILKNSYFFNSEDIINNAIKEIDKEKGKGNIPPDIKTKFLKELLDNKKCICGTPLEENSEPRKQIEKLLKLNETNENKEILVDLSYILYGIISKNKNENSHILTIEENINKFKESLKKTSEELQELNEDIAKMPHFKGNNNYYNELQSQKTFYESKIAEENQALGKYKHIEEELNNEKSNIDNQREQLTKNMEEATYLKKYNDYTKYLKKLFENFTENFFEEFYNLLKSNFNEYIDKFPRVSKYKLNIIRDSSKSNSNKLRFTYLQAGMSQGQSQVTGIVLIAAFTNLLNKIAKNVTVTPFVVMDHPYSYFDKEAIDDIFSNINILFKGVQLIIFVPDKEFDEYYEKSIDKISSIYILDKESDSQKTTLRKVELKNEN